jgi:hypothetical protein
MSDVEINARDQIITDHGEPYYDNNFELDPNPSMPRAAIPRQVFEENIQLQQRNDEEEFNHNIMLLHEPQADQELYFERLGFLPNPQYGERRLILDEFRTYQDPLSELADLIARCPAGHAIRNGDRWRGYTIGEIVQEVQSRPGNLLRGMYLDAEVFALNVHMNVNTATDVSQSYNKCFYNMTTSRLPMWMVEPIRPRDADFPFGFNGGTIDEVTQGFQNTLAFKSGITSVVDMDALDLEANPDIASIPGSDLSAYFLVANVRFVRRVRSPSYVDDRVKMIRTGGFSELITETRLITITMAEVVDAYIEYEGLHTENFGEDYVNEYRRVVASHFSVDIFTCEEKTLTLVVPGGNSTLCYDGCCIDNATYNFLLLAQGGDAQLVSELMYRVRARFEELYIEWRCSKRGGRKRRGGPDAPSLSQSFFSNTLCDQERRGMLADLRRTTRNGYSSQIFKFFQTAVHCITGYLPCIYYHRIEKARDYNDGVRVRMVQVGGGTLSKSISADREENGGYYPINMLRIDLNGKIHRHRPKSLCCEDMVEYIPDDDSTGLLHSITLYPGMPDDLFKGVNAKKRDVLFSVIEKKTQAFMDDVKKRAVGLLTPTLSELRISSTEQKCRQDRGITNTLIYGRRRVESFENVTAPASTPRVSSSDDGSVGMPTPSTYYSNSFNIHGEKVPDRPLVIAYDIETVTLTMEAIDSGMVGEEFIKPNPNPNQFIPAESQIPFCVSWVPVNLSDEGRHRVLKSSLHARGDVCSDMREEEEWSGRWEGSDKWVYCSDGRRVRVGYILLDQVRVHYGGYVLGRCINEFMNAVMEWALQRGYTSVYAYAHNGVGFDSYIVQSYNTLFEYNSILKTSRGILSMRARIPFETTTKLRKMFPISFVDTKVFLSFSLSKLCSDFKVPSNWGKLDFPITKITWRNCYNKDVLSILEGYSINDARSLAYIIKQINRIVCLDTEMPHVPGSDEMCEEALQLYLSRRAQSSSGEGSTFDLDSLHPPVPQNPKPPIAQFCTIMSCVKKVACAYILQSRRINPSIASRMPMACDLPSVRHWIEMASMGGRVSPYAKLYCSSRWKDVLSAYEGGDKKKIASIIKEAIECNDTSVVLDVTSLYPSAMAYCAMPMGSLSCITPDQCHAAIENLACPECERVMTLCPTHRHTARPFCIILVKGGLRRREGWVEMNKNYPYRHLVGRKMKGRRERGGTNAKHVKLPGADVGGVIYDCEDDIEMTNRYWGEGSSLCSVLGTTQSYTNIDLYWAWRSGFQYDVIGGFQWETTYELQPLILELFNMRVQAKKEGNTCLQQALKLVLNSLFGIHSQRVIRTVDKILTLPSSIRNADVLEEEFAKYIRANHQKIFDPRMKLKENIPLANGQSMVRAEIAGDIGEAVGGYSPNQVGCAVLAWARHIMSLAMFNIPTGHLTYTDTDSLAVSEWWYKHMVSVSETTCAEMGIPPLINLCGSDLLTYKNDHSDHYRDPRVLFSAIGAKKVKMHIIGCPDTGELKICNTFKGFLKQDTLENGDRLHPDSYEYTMSKALLDILYDGVPVPYKGTRWDRNLRSGVQINRDVKVDGESYTYMGKHQGMVSVKLKNSPSKVVVWIPFGVDRDAIRDAEGVEGDSARIICCNKILKTQRLPGRVHSPSQFLGPPNRYIYHIPSEWEAEVLGDVMDGVSRERMYDFIHSIFSHQNEVYKPASEESNAVGESSTAGADESCPESNDPQAGEALISETHIMEEDLQLPGWDEMMNIFESVWEGEEEVEHEE